MKKSIVDKKAKIAKAVIYITLLIIFFRFSMIQVFQQFLSKKTNFAKYTIPDNGINIPALSFCFNPMIKMSIRKSYNISAMFCLDPYMADRKRLKILEEQNMTWNELCSNLSYKLDRDFTLKLKNGFLASDEEMELHKNVNHFNGKKVEVREILSKYDGLCYTLLSDFKFINNNIYLIKISAMVCLIIQNTSYELSFKKIQNF